jgi:hypothetical protein
MKRIILTLLFIILMPTPSFAERTEYHGVATGTEIDKLSGIQSNIQDQLNTKANKSVIGTSIGNGLALQNTILNVSSVLQKYNGVDPTSDALTLLGHSFLQIKSDLGLGDSAFLGKTSGTGDYLPVVASASLTDGCASWSGNTLISTGVGCGSGEGGGDLPTGCSTGQIPIYSSVSLLWSCGDPSTASVSNEVFSPTWSGVSGVSPSKNSVYNKIILLSPLANPAFTGIVTIPGYVNASSGLRIGSTQVESSATQLNYIKSATGITGTPTTNLVFSTSPTLVTPVLGIATATSINKVTITQPSVSATLTILNGKTLTSNNTLTLSGTDGSTLNIGTGGTLGTAAYSESSTYQAYDPDLTTYSLLPPSTDAQTLLGHSFTQMKTDLLINNINNTSDTNKPVSTAQQSALNLKLDISSPTFIGTLTGPSITSNAADGLHAIQCSNTGAMTTSGWDSRQTGTFCWDASLAKFRYWNGSILTDMIPSGGSMTYPAAAGIANYAGSSAWGTSITTSADLYGVITNETGSATGTPLLVFNQSPRIDNIELGDATDTTIARSSAGVITIEGVTATRTIASGTSTLGTSSIGSGACATEVSTAATGVQTTDVINWTPNADLTAVTGYVPSANGILTIYSRPIAGYVNYKVCNNTASSITPGAVTLNWQVTR